MADRSVLSKKIAYSYFVAVGFLFVFCVKTCEDLERTGNILWTGKYIGSLLVLSLLVGGLLGAVVCFLLYKLALREEIFAFGKMVLFGKPVLPGKVVPPSGTGSIKKPHFFWGSFGLSVLGFVPTFLAFYPAICAYDTIYQLDQAMKNYLIEHHPLVHTLLIKGIVNFGIKVMGSANSGIAIYALLQVLLLSLAFAFGLTAMHHYKVKWYWQVLALVYCVCYPFHHYLGVSITKDTIFGAFFLIAIVSFCCILREGRNEFKPGWSELVLAVSIVGIVLFRANGKYALLVLIVFGALALLKGKNIRKLLGRLLCVTIVGLLVGQVILSAVFRFSGAEQGDKREMLSMPIQQLARTMIYHGGVGVKAEDDNTMSDVDKALVNDFLLNESYKSYKPVISDPVKTHTNTYVVRYRTVEFAKTYLNLLTQYPGDFVNAGLAVNAGYLNPGDATHAYVYEREGAVGEGYVAVIEMSDTLAEWGIYKDSKWPWLYEKKVEWADANAYLDMPVLKYLFVPGVYLWLYLVLAGYLMICKRFRYLMPLGLVFGYFITLFLGPTVQLRYIYPLMIALPFAVLLSGGEKEREDLC